MDLYNQSMEKFENVSSKMEEQKYVCSMKSENEETSIKENDCNNHSRPDINSTDSLKSLNITNAIKIEEPSPAVPKSIPNENGGSFNFSNNFPASSACHEEKYSSKTNAQYLQNDLDAKSNSIKKQISNGTAYNDDLDYYVKIENVDNERGPVFAGDCNSDLAKGASEMYDEDTEEDDVEKKPLQEDPITGNAPSIRKCDLADKEDTSTELTSTIEQFHLQNGGHVSEDCPPSCHINGSPDTPFDGHAAVLEESLLEHNTSNENEEEEDEDEEDEEEDEDDDDDEDEDEVDIDSHNKEIKTPSEKIDDSVNYVYKIDNGEVNTTHNSFPQASNDSMNYNHNIFNNNHNDEDNSVSMSGNFTSSFSQNCQPFFANHYDHTRHNDGNESQFNDESNIINDITNSNNDSVNNNEDEAVNSNDEISQNKKSKEKKKKRMKDGEEGEGGSDEVVAAGEERMKKKRKKKNKRSGEDKKARLEMKKNIFERKNIRKIFEDENLDEETKVAQKEEMERKQRLLEIQEKLKQQAIELRAQRERDLAAQKLAAISKAAAEGRSAAGRLAAREEALTTTMSLKSLLESGKRTSPCPSSETDKPEQHDVVEISSSDDDDNKDKEDDDDDDDLIIMSEEEEEEDDGAADAETSGSHVNDLLNRPDVNGCVLVNVGHPADEDDIFLAPQLASAVKPHQIGGIRFMYDNVVESLERYKTSNGFGCILAHSMGLGKTIQVVSFVDIFLRHTEARSVLIIVPVNTLQNWLNEFNMWLPVVEEEGGGAYGGGGGCGAIDKDILWPREFKLYIINDNLKSCSSRTRIVMDWHRTGGVLLLGYEMYRLLIKTRGSAPKSRRAKKMACSSSSNDPVVIDVDEEEGNKEALKNLNEALVRPGPDLVVCDEGHRIKNSHASISQVLKNIRTRRRIVLTGYPLQNNLLEYWCMVDFVRPNYLGSKQEFCNMFERPIMNGQCADSTAKDAKLMRFRAHVLHSLLEGFVQRRGHAVLQSALPQKDEYVLFIRLSGIQRTLYNHFMAAIKDSGNLGCWSNTNNPIKAFSVCCKIWNHPDILYQVVEQRKDDNDLDLDEAKGDPSLQTSIRKCRRGASNRATGPSNGSNQSNRGIFNEDSNNKTPDDAADDRTTNAAIGATVTNERKESQAINYDWAIDAMRDYQVGREEHSGKMLILMDLVDEAVKVGDKILAFSQSLYTLTLIEEYLWQRRVPGRQEHWQKNKNYFRLDGGTAGIEREKLINQFNDYNNSSVHLFLLSTRAGCLGINLIGACRVVIFDASWNPCHDCQAVCRVYRYGQNKCCSVYRLVSDNTMEKNIYDRQINKQGISDRVVDEMNPQNLLAKKQVDVLMRSEEEEPGEISLKGFEEKCADQVLLKVISRHKHWLTKEPFTHESLLLDRKDQKLTRREKKLAKQGYEMEKKMALMGIKQPSLYAKSLDGVSMLRLGQRPVASVRPMLPSGLGGTSAVNRVGILNHRNNNQFRAPGLKPGVSVQQIQTTTDIIIPGTTTLSDSTSGSGGSNKIPAGEKVLVIKTPKGVYIRTSQGKIFAVRTAPKLPTTTTTTSTTTTTITATTTTTTTTATGTTTTSMASCSKKNANDDVMQIDDDDDDEVEEAEGVVVRGEGMVVRAEGVVVRGESGVGDKGSKGRQSADADKELPSLSSQVTSTTAAAPPLSTTTTTNVAATKNNTTATSTSTAASSRKISDSPNTPRFINNNTPIGNNHSRPPNATYNNNNNFTTTFSSNQSSSDGKSAIRNSSGLDSSAATADAIRSAPVSQAVPLPSNHSSSNSHSGSSNHNNSKGSNYTNCTDARKPSKSSRKAKEKENKNQSPSSAHNNFPSPSNNINKLASPPRYPPNNNIATSVAQQASNNNTFMEWNKKTNQSNSFSTPHDFNIPAHSTANHSRNIDDPFTNYFKTAANNNNNLPPQHKQQQQQQQQHAPFNSSNNNSSQSSRSFPTKAQPSFPQHAPSPLHHAMPPPSYLPYNIAANPYSWISNPMWMPASDPTYPFGSEYPSLPPTDFPSFAPSDPPPHDPSCFPPFNNSFDSTFSSLLMTNEDDRLNNNNHNNNNNNNGIRGASSSYRQNSSYPMMPAYHTPSSYNPYLLPPSKHPTYYNQASSSISTASHPGLSPPRQQNYFPLQYPLNQATPSSSFMPPYDFTAARTPDMPKKNV